MRLTITSINDVKKPPIKLTHLEPTPAYKAPSKEKPESAYGLSKPDGTKMQADSSRALL